MKTELSSLGLILICISLSFSSCKDYEKKKFLAQEEALKEIEAERNEERRETFMAQSERESEKIEASTIAEGETTSRGQSLLMERDSSFKFSGENSIGFDFEIIGKNKFTLDNQKSETNGKYMLYKEAKALEADGIINYKMRLSGSSNFSVEGTFVKKK